MVMVEKSGSGVLEVEQFRIVRLETQANGKDIKELDFTNVPSKYVMTNKE